MARVRADQLLVRRGLAPSRESARRLIMAGRARSGTTTLVKPATLLDDGAPLDLRESERYVSRGGRKLEAALDAFAIDVRGLRCLDVGASTGGFTDCLLQRGAASVLAVDVGRGQLHQRLREDARVTVMERTNARALPPLPPLDFFVADVSFISLRKVLPATAARLPAGTPGLALLKPQFEAGPERAPGGVVRDEAVRAEVRESFRAWALGEGWEVGGARDSALPGPRGNREIFVRLATPARAEAPC